IFSVRSPIENTKHNSIINFTLFFSNSFKKNHKFLFTHSIPSKTFTFSDLKSSFTLKKLVIGNLEINSLKKKMAKVISQETYDEVIKENIIEFSMSVEESREETIKQFEAQGVNLANIIKDLTINETTGQPILSETIEKIKNCVNNPYDQSDGDLEKALDVLISELSKSVPHRVNASKNNTQDYLLKLIKTELWANDSDRANSIMHKLILSAHAMTNKNPDIFDDKSLSVILELLDSLTNENIICDVLKWIQKACLLHEMNRQLIVNEDILVKHLKPLLKRNETEIIKNVSICFRYLILDDDIRVEFGKAHEHARMIAQECLVELTSLMTKFKSNPDMLSELMLTIASLTVRNEFCEMIADAGGITLIMDAMVEFQDSIKVIRESFKLLKALAGNDKVKADIIKCGIAPIIESSLNRHKCDETIAKSALVCISTLALRVKDNSSALFEAGIAETVIETLKIHEKNKLVQRNGAWAIRNMVSRSREQCETWMNLGAEDVLSLARKNHPSVDHDTKAALRDLGAKIHLEEEWKGTAEKPITNE
ncbi:CLUMA_CG009853, isoform A, partial [Clunio marinus]